MSERSLAFRSRNQARYWWFRNSAHDYVPPVYGFLTEEEWSLLREWYERTDEAPAPAGECNIPAISTLQGLVMGSGIAHVVQLGHYQGYSTLLLGFMMRRMGYRRSVFSIDLSADASAFTLEWVDRAGLKEYVEVMTSDSAAPEAVNAASAYFEEAPELVFVDSSHGYRHTLRELNAWYTALRPGGVMLLHDTSEYAAEFDPDQEGGVLRAMREWAEQKGVPALSLNGGFSREVGARARPVYADPCGLGLIHKPY